MRYNYIMNFKTNARHMIRKDCDNLIETMLSYFPLLRYVYEEIKINKLRLMDFRPMLVFLYGKNADNNAIMYINILKYLVEQSEIIIKPGHLYSSYLYICANNYYIKYIFNFINIDKSMITHNNVKYMVEIKQQTSKNCKCVKPNRYLAINFNTSGFELTRLIYDLSI